MLPVYLLYFAGGTEENKTTARVVVNALGFVSGFTVLFVVMGAFAGFFGGLLSDYGKAVNIITGSIVVLFGLGYMGVFDIGFSRLKILNALRIQYRVKNLSFFSAFVLGLIISIGWVPCTGPFLGAALLKASQQGYVSEGMLMLFVYSMGLGVPFIISAVLINRLKNAFDFIKKHYRRINIVSGVLLVLIGILMITGIYAQ